MKSDIVENEIELKTVTQLLGINFHVPEYQRGYRWTKHNVKQLLDDIWEYRTKGTAHSFYCLQPVVVKKASWADIDGNPIEGYELIDGQQRLTTLHRIITYLMLEHLKTNLLSEGYSAELFAIFYRTRLESKKFLEKNEYNDTKPDLYFMSEAYLYIKTWFEDGTKGTARAVRDAMLNVILPGIVKDLDGKFINPEWSVQIIWYEVNNKENSRELFTRLNRGKIPLTAAELIKAKFVNSKSFESKTVEEQIKRKTEIVQIWDEIEAGLNETKFWAFITNKCATAYSSKIELLFDVMVGKEDKETDPLFSFLHFFRENENADSIWKKWIRVEELYRSFRYWYGDKNLYHKVGYLIAIGTSAIKLIQQKKEKKKSKFEKSLDELIGKSIPEDWDSMQFNQLGDKEKISRVLLLHNLEILRSNDKLNEFFPFEIYKKITKSLEHIHAQNIEDIDPNKKEQWQEWLQEHISLLSERAEGNEAIKGIINDTHQAYPRLTFQLFKMLSQRILSFFNNPGDEDLGYLHRIENLALLGLNENIVLSNSVFEVKRRKVISMDRQGEFVPTATKRVFLKYFSGESQPHYTLWTAADRENYLDDIRRYLVPYLTEEENAIAHEN